MELAWEMVLANVRCIHLLRCKGVAIVDVGDKGLEEGKEEDEIRFLS